MNNLKIPKGGKAQDKGKIAERIARLGEALRENLKKRREQTRGRCKN